MSTINLLYIIAIIVLLIALFELLVIIRYIGTFTNVSVKVARDPELSRKNK